MSWKMKKELNKVYFPICDGKWFQINKSYGGLVMQK